jgi:hypothetical protein
MRCVILLQGLSYFNFLVQLHFTFSFFLSRLSHFGEAKIKKISHTHTHNSFSIIHTGTLLRSIHPAGEENRRVHSQMPRQQRPRSLLGVRLRRGQL